MRDPLATQQAGETKKGRGNLCLKGTGGKQLVGEGFTGVTPRSLCQTVAEQTPIRVVGVYKESPRVPLDSTSNSPLEHVCVGGGGGELEAGTRPGAMNTGSKAMQPINFCKT